MPAHIEDCRNNEEKAYGILRNHSDGHLYIYIKNQNILKWPTDTAAEFTARHLVPGTLVDSQPIDGKLVFNGEEIDQEVHVITGITDRRDYLKNLNLQSKAFLEGHS